MDMDLGKDVHN